MPVNILSTAYEAVSGGKTFTVEPYPVVGIIKLNDDTMGQLANTLDVNQAGWEFIDQAMVYRRAASLGITSEEVSSPEQALGKIELIYLIQSVKYFGIAAKSMKISEAWVAIKQSYESYRTSLPHEELPSEDNRFQTAMALQLNKYTATWEEIYTEMEALGLEVVNS